MNMIAAIAAGGALGAVLRYLFNMVAVAIAGEAFPWGTLCVNVLGSFLMGVAVSIFSHYWTPPDDVRAFVMVGLLGSFTTFSTYSVDMIGLWSRGETFSALTYGVASVILSLGAIIIGLTVTRNFLS